eukprot:gene20795-biopygen13417
MPSEIPSLAQGIGGSTLGSASASVHAPRRSGSTAALASTSTSTTPSNNGGGKKIKVCSEPSCSKPAKKKCNACKVARYCCAACQKKHWRLEPHGHKTECDVLAALKKKEAFLFTASDGAGAEQGGGGGVGGSSSASVGGGPACAAGGGGGGSSGGSSSDDDVASTATLSSLADAESEDGGDGEGQACYICLDADDGVVPLGCGCRGAAGGAHVLCMVEAAAHAEVQTARASWHKCSLCHQVYTGKMQMGLAGERVRRVQHVPETDEESVAAHLGLANALTAESKHSEAEMVLRKVLALCQRLFGAEHQNTLAAAHNLAECLRHQRKFEEAIKLFKSILRSQRRVFGMEHRSTLYTKSALATALQENGQFEEAEKMFRTTLKTMKRVLPKNDAYILTALNNFAGLLDARLRKHAEADAMYREVLTIRLQVLGPEHPQTLTTKENISITLCRQGKHAEALPLARESYRGYTKVYSSKHPRTLDAASRLGSVLMKLGEYAESEAILRATLVLQREVLGPEHQETNQTAENLQTLTLISNGNATVQTFYWFRKAAEAGNAAAQFNLGHMYRNGQGVEQDFSKALKWLQLAAAQGVEEALKILNDLQQANAILTPPPGTAVTTILLTSANAAKYNNRTGSVVEPTEGAEIKPGRAAVLLAGVAAPISFKLQNLQIHP